MVSAEGLRYLKTEDMFELLDIETIGTQQDNPEKWLEREKRKNSLI